MTEIFTYDRFQAGALLGVWEEAIDVALLEQWAAIFGSHSRDVPARDHGLAVACMMRAYLGVVSPRPPGNIHARQKLSILSRLGPGDVLRSEIWCREKEMRRERRYLTLEVVGSAGEGRPVYAGEMALIWAA